MANVVEDEWLEFKADSFVGRKMTPDEEHVYKMCFLAGMAAGVCHRDYANLGRDVQTAAHDLTQSAKTHMVQILP